MKIVVDPRLELLSIIQFFSDYGTKYRPLTEFESSYSEAVLEYFSNYRNHPVVTLFSQLVGGGFNFSYPVDLVLDLEFDLENNLLVQNKPVAGPIAASAGGMGRVESFVREMADYAKRADFARFFENNKPLYSAITDEVRVKLSGFDVTAVFAHYYGVRYEGYNLVLNPLCDPGGYGIWKENEAGGVVAYAVTGPVKAAEGTLHFVGEPEGLCAFIWHEFSHSVINPLTTSYREELHKFAILFEPIADKMKTLAYGKWEFCLNEHLVRACVIRLLAREFAENRAQELLDYERNLGFYLLDPLLAWFRNYEKDRACYNNFGEYFPSVMAVLAKLC